MYLLTKLIILIKKYSKQTANVNIQNNQIEDSSRTIGIHFCSSHPLQATYKKTGLIQVLFMMTTTLQLRLKDFLF